jgi:hypothetical protein
MNKELKFSILEGFYDYGYKETGSNPTPTQIQNNQIVPLKRITTDYQLSTNKISSNNNDIKQNIDNINELKNQMLANNDIYDFSGNTFMLSSQKKPTLQDARTEDLNQIILAENATYILGSITLATLLVTLIIVNS